ncbi:2OG-Fe(II) oxygenase family protein [Geodermatophilus obscurus]|uniref:2OG-Fe(II) oxygenase family protein n=1 Tax=Geodermatophilus obscurus TaxID=1861 RepID=UPI000AFA9C00
MPGAFVVNIGELMEYATDRYLKATVHRVVSPPPGDTRLSIPFFLNPALDSAIAPHRAARGARRPSARGESGPGRCHLRNLRR